MSNNNNTYGNVLKYGLATITIISVIYHIGCNILVDDDYEEITVNPQKTFSYWMNFHCDIDTLIDIYEIQITDDGNEKPSYTRLKKIDAIKSFSNSPEFDRLVSYEEFEHEIRQKIENHAEIQRHKNVIMNCDANDSD